jgi:hypothetical protein
MPWKRRASDIGFNVTIYAIDKELPYGGIRYETGLMMQPDDGWYCELVPRSSFSDSGWFMPNSIAVLVHLQFLSVC